MILIVSDTHCHYEIVNMQIEYAENSLGVSVSCVIHLGDFGVYKSQLSDYFIKKRNRFIRPLYFIDGNHEDFDSFQNLVEKYQEFFTYLPRATVHEIEGYRFLSLGGTAYMDSMITQRGAVITDKQIDDCLAIPSDKVDIILTHDCPVGIGMPNTPGMEHFGETGFKRSDEMADHFRPKLWLFGHHHKWFSSKNSYTAYFGLCGIWKGFGLLDEKYNFEIIKNKIEWEETPLFEKMLIKLKIIRPDSPEK